MNADRILFSFFWHKRNPIWNRQWCRVDTKWTMASEFPLFIHNRLYYRRKKYNKSNYWCRRVIKKRILCIVVSWYIRTVCSPRMFARNKAMNTQSKWKWIYGSEGESLNQIYALCSMALLYKGYFIIIGGIMFQTKYRRWKWNKLSKQTRFNLFFLPSKWTNWFKV